ncbi:MAG: hypothetical protein MHPSP_004464, partial [Paramarteilia canceri]
EKRVFKDNEKFKNEQKNADKTEKLAVSPFNNKTNPEKLSSNFLSQKFQKASSTSSENPNKLDSKLNIRDSRILECLKNEKYGLETRIVTKWNPSKLLCKRFNVPYNEIRNQNESMTFEKEPVYDVKKVEHIINKDANNADDELDDNFKDYWKKMTANDFFNKVFDQ